MIGYVIRAARSDELDRVREIEQRAGVHFESVGLAAVASLPIQSVAMLERARESGCLFVVAGDANDRAVAFAVVAERGDDVHLNELDVDPEHARRGLGRGLIEHIARWARERGRSRITLTTFRDVPWNGPYYARLGFRVLPDAELDARLAAIRAGERDGGIELAPRVAMALPLQSAPGGHATRG